MTDSNQNFVVEDKKSEKKTGVLPEVIAKLQEQAKKHVAEMKEQREEKKILDDEKAVKLEKSEKSEKLKQLLTDCDNILAEYGGQESNIPINHHYWTMRNMARSKRRS